MRKIWATALLVICVLSTLLAGTASAEAIGQVTGVRSTRQNASQVVLTWDRVPGADTYRVYHDGRAGIMDEGSDKWAVIGSLRPVTSYEVTVAAVIDGTEGPLSDPISVTTTNLTLIKKTPFIDIARSDVLVVKWQQRWPIESYDLFRDGIKIATVQNLDASYGYFDYDVESGTSYTYQVREIGPLGELGPLGGSVTGTTAGLPPGTTPDAPNVTNTFVDKSRAVLRIENKEDTLGLPLVWAYRITRDGQPIALPVAANYMRYTWVRDDDVLPGTTYTYGVQAISFDHIEGPITEVAVTTPGTPPGPLDLRTTRVEPRKVVLHWNTIPGYTYDVLRDGRRLGSSDNGWFANTTSPSTSYEYTVKLQFVPFEDLPEIAAETVSVTTPAAPGGGDPLRESIERAAEAARFGFAPYRFSTLVPTCDGCDFEAETLVWVTGNDVVHSWNLPAGHPGVRDPMSIHGFLLESPTVALMSQRLFGPTERRASGPLMATALRAHASNWPIDRPNSSSALRPVAT